MSHLSPAVEPRCECSTKTKPARNFEQPNGLLGELDLNWVSDQVEEQIARRKQRPPTLQLL